jgi:hypothetical protein
MTKRRLLFARGSTLTVLLGTQAFRGIVFVRL